jgi:uncharacterized Zn finger protein
MDRNTCETFFERTMMANLPKLKTSDIRRLASSESYSRGEDYYESGAVISTIRRGNTIIAEVEGSQYEPYTVSIVWDKGGIKDTECTCPYDWGGICKHIVAVLLTYLHNSKTIVEKPGPAELIESLTHDDLRSLFTRLLEHHPELLDWVESECEVKKTKTRKPRSRKTTLDAAPFQKQVQHIFQRSEFHDSYHGLSDILHQLEEIRKQAIEFLNHDDGKNALTILLTLAEEVAENFEMVYDHDGDLFEFIASLKFALVESILSIELSSADREEVIEKLEKIQSFLADYGHETDLEIPVLAAKEGWKADDVVQEEISGEDEEEKEWEREWLPSPPSLADAKLNILNRRGEHDEFLSLALQTEQHRRYTLKLIELNRIVEACEYALRNLKTAEDAFEVGKSLREKGEMEKAIQVGERGLALPGSKHSLGKWLGEIAMGTKNPALALKSEIASFESLASLESYKLIKGLAQDSWKTVKPRLIKTLQKSYDHDVLVDVYLYEGEVEKAIKLAEKDPQDYSLVEKVAEAAIETHPDWVIRTSGKQAESLIAKTQSKYYVAAIRWLEKAKKAYRKKGEKKAWEKYLSELRKKYPKKRAFIEMLKKLEEK